jgi:hypothetical protein
VVLSLICVTIVSVLEMWDCASSIACILRIGADSKTLVRCKKVTSIERVGSRFSFLLLGSSHCFGHVNRPKGGRDQRRS